MRAIAEKRERETGDRPEYGVFVAAILVAESPPVIKMAAKVSREEQMNSEKERDPPRVNAEDEGQSADRFIQHDRPHKPFRQSQRGEIFSGIRHPENKSLEIDAVQKEQNAHAHPQKQRSVRARLRVDHLASLRRAPGAVLRLPATRARVIANRVQCLTA
jgi:hypothetical protein